MREAVKLGPVLAAGFALGSVGFCRSEDRARFRRQHDNTEWLHPLSAETRGSRLGSPPPSTAAL